jgi:hypothetical protein
MKVFARDLFHKKAVTFTTKVMHDVLRGLPEHYERVRVNWFAEGTEAVVRDNDPETNWPMEYRITVTPIERPKDVTVQ